ncbi:hypothetical protein DY000_02048700 [Brassica cretica]|uniref:Uncharacterized protein n=1 Tax=Brassica cretica TaxID=69181 RepID=A0ABQ7EYU8_BRACR|nr:hypothetical protein DY000_02048700 [Brassica cretica]
MAHSDSPSGDESPSTDAAPTAAGFEDIILEITAQQDAIQKATNEQLATIAAILAPLAGNSADTATTARNRRRVQVILARPSSLSDKEEDAKVCNSQEHPAGLQSQSSDPIGTCDLRSKLKRKSHAAESMHAQSSTCLGLNESRATASDPV